MIETPPRNPRLDALTGVRFFAAIHVVLFHNAGFFSGAPRWIQDVIHHGYTGVSLFFILSGFILAYTYLDRPSLDVRAFLVARVARVYPAYLLALILAMPLFAYFVFRTLPPTQAAAKSVIVGLSELVLVQAWVPFTMGGANPPGWSLSVEAFLYVAFPVVAFWLVRRSVRWIIGAIAGLWALAILPAVIHAAVSPSAPELPGPAWIQPVDPVWNLIFANPLLHLGQFTAGVAAGILFLRGARVASSTSGATAAEALALAATVIVFLATSAGWLTEPMLNTGFLLVIYVPFLLVLAGGRGLLANALSHRWIVLLGGASYGIYIFQAPIRSWMQLLARRVFGVEWGGGLFVVYLVVLIAFSIGAFFVEERIRPALRTYLLRKTQPAKRTYVEAAAR